MGKWYILSFNSKNIEDNRDEILIVKEFIIIFLLGYTSIIRSYEDTTIHFQINIDVQPIFDNFKNSFGKFINFSLSRLDNDFETLLFPDDNSINNNLQSHMREYESKMTNSNSELLERFNKEYHSNK